MTARDPGPDLELKTTLNFGLTCLVLVGNTNLSNRRIELRQIA